MSSNQSNSPRTLGEGLGERADENGIAIRVTNLSKCYEIYATPRDRLKQFVMPRVRRIAGKAHKQYFREFWALKDVSFEIKKGETVGIIGRNGSGKSTLLQMICGTLHPTSGSIQTNGRIAALLELGAGFNPEFSGRENVYLNGSVLGLSKEEIDARFDEIAAFADIGDFIEQPVKTYSSGMFVRLAFAVQTSIDPEILIVDEALSVGDAAFTAKCMRRMRRLVDNGTTILFVSHDIGSVRQLCSRAIWLDNGAVAMSGSAAETSAAYFEYSFEGTKRSSKYNESAPEGKGITVKSHSTFDDSRSGAMNIKGSLHEGVDNLVRWGDGRIRLEEIVVSGSAVLAAGLIQYGKMLEITVRATVGSEDVAENIGFGLAFRTIKGLDVITSTTIEAVGGMPKLMAGDEAIVKFSLDNILAPGDYFIVANIERRDGGSSYYFDFIENALQVKVISDVSIYSLALPHVKHEITIRNNDFRN